MHPIIRLIAVIAMLIIKISFRNSKYSFIISIVISAIKKSVDVEDIRKYTKKTNYAKHADNKYKYYS